MFAQTKHFTIMDGADSSDRLATLDGVGMGAIQASQGGIADFLNQGVNLASKGVDIFDKLKKKKREAPPEIKITMPEGQKTNFTPFAIGGGVLALLAIAVFAMKK